MSAVNTAASSNGTPITNGLLLIIRIEVAPCPWCVVAPSLLVKVANVLSACPKLRMWVGGALVEPAVCAVTISPFLLVAFNWTPSGWLRISQRAPALVAVVAEPAQFSVAKIAIWTGFKFISLDQRAPSYPPQFIEPKALPFWIVVGLVCVPRLASKNNPAEPTVAVVPPGLFCP